MKVPISDGDLHEISVQQIDQLSPIKLKDIANPSETLMIGLAILKRLGLYHWISCGTILGLHRDGALIPDDTDLDIGILTSTGNPFGPHGERIAEQFPDHLRTFRILTFDKKNVMQLAFKDESQNNVIFDLYFYYTDLGESDEFVNINKRTPVLRKPASMFGKLEMWDSPIGPVPCPIDRDAYCEMRYGPNWRTPSNKKGIYNGQF
jgi:hypothetical protein